MKKVTLIIIACIAMNACAQKGSKMDQHDYTPIQGFQLEQYLGTWYEIARFPHSFEKNLVGVTANYSMKKNGKVKVVNAGYKNSLDGKYKTATGKAKFGSEPATGYLKVSFFLFFYGDYFILDLDKKEYKWAMVGSSSPNYFWILSRTPVMEDSIYNKLITEARERGYDLSNLQKVPQKIQ
ncbi:MAG: lipocalin family protein [Bacteroidales bacterium]|nr:lipocalin family protein [Bacteroidales bacterium]